MMPAAPNYSGNFKLVIFDLAGTTVQDRGEVPAAFESVLAEVGLQLSAAQITAVRGASKREALKSILPPERVGELDTIFERFVATLSEKYRSGGAAPIMGAADVFAQCRELGLLIALNTGFDRRITELLIESLGWRRDLFCAVVCGDDVARGRPAPDLINTAMARAQLVDPSLVINVGDTVLDMQAGQNAHVGANIGVLSGAHSFAQLSATPNTCLIGSIRDLPIVLGGLRAS